MKIWGIGQISNEEKRDILDKHKSLYDGYRTMQPQYSNEQPLYVWDSAGDKGGVTVNNRGEVKSYTNVGINESFIRESSHEIDEAKNMCECGGMMYEGECNECGWKMEEIEEEMQQVEDLDNVSDLDMSDSFDYVKGATNKTGSFKISAHEDSSVDALAMQDVTGQEAPHDADDMAPDGMDDDSDNNRKMMADGEMEEQGGNADDMDVDNVASAYNFVSGGPKAGMDFPNYSEDESGETDFEDNTDEIDEDEDMDSGDEVPSFDANGKFLGMTSKGSDMSFTDLIDADNELEDEREELEEQDPEFEYMESAWSDEEMAEQMGLYSEKDPAHHFKSGGPQQFAGPLARINDGEVDEQGEDEDVYWEKDLDDDELDLDLTVFNPEDASWEEIKAHTGNWDEIDEDLQESFVKQKNRIMEMMNRMKII